MREEAEYKGGSGAVSLGARRRRDAEGVSERHTATAQRASSGDDTLGTRLRAERERSGLTLRELARRLEVSPSLVSQIETGKSQPSVRTLYAIVSELGISLDELFAPADGPPRPRAGDAASRRHRPGHGATGTDASSGQTTAT